MDLQYFVPTKVIMNKGCSANVGHYIQENKYSHVLIISDQGIKKAGLLNNIYKSLEEHQILYDEFCDVKPNPRDTDCDIAAHQFSDKPIDGIIAIGGGSVIDTAKTVSILCTNGGKTKDYEGMGVAKVEPLPIICIPTTAGTGSEVTSWSIITDTTHHYKLAIGDDRIIPKLALLDVHLTASLPAGIAASTGMDALTHAIEAYTCNIATAITDGLALHAIKLIKENVMDAVYGSDNETARENMLVASLIAGIAFGNADTAGVHCLSEAIGGRYDTPHGVANSIILPYMFHYNMDADYKKHGEVGYALGVEPDKTSIAAARGAVDILLDLNKRLSIPSFYELDHIDPNDFQQLAAVSAKNESNPHNAKAMAATDYLKVIDAAWNGSDISSGK